ncbi:hypothetical protein EC2726800_1350 [Escherichia coli 2726800]|nr:hypothetical protein EC2726800_1350 [Escherichia coli 2726800]ENA20466.1 hypothetical protein EC2016001_3464 [Escherichia coli 201600.1]ENB94070.1 hypothetical protein ECP02994384_5272 [Escherichia coli P0299438.4]END46865.1 hypothetical protein EC2854350_5073 [Escherichia coli 2854350]
MRIIHTFWIKIAKINNNILSIIDGAWRDINIPSNFNLNISQNNI